MTHHETRPTRWRLCLLAAFPGALYLTWIIAQTLAAGRFVQASIIALATVLAAIGLLRTVRAGRAPTWTLAGVGLALSALLGGAWDFLLTPSGISIESPTGLQPAGVLLPEFGLALFTLTAYAALLWAVYRRAPADGPIVALLLVGPVTLLAFAIMDPTYGFFLYLDSLPVNNRALTAGVEALTLLPALILLPLWVLRARSRCSQAWGVLTMSALSLELMALAPLVTAVARAQQNVFNAPPLAEAIPYTVLVRTAFATFFWGLLALVVHLTLRPGQERPQPHPPPSPTSDISLTP